MDNVKETIAINSRKETDSYKVKFENGIFEFGFGKYDDDSKELKIHTEFGLQLDDFKVYFISIIKSINEYNDKTGKNFLDELIKEDD